jgi:predicted ATPase
MLKKIRIQNFKCLQDTNDLEIKPLTFLVGPNSSGKSSVFQAILALKQTVDSGDTRSPLILQDYVDLGSYKDVLYKHDTKKDIKIDFEDKNILKWSVTFSIQEKGKMPGRIFVKSFELSSKELDSSGFWTGPPPLPERLKLIREKRSQGYKLFIEGQNIPNRIFDLNKFYMITPKKSLGTLDKETNLTIYFEVIRTMTESLFEHIYHIGPLRNEPKRVYSASGAYPLFVGKHGQWTIEIIQYGEELRDTITHWLNKFNISLDFTLEELKKGSQRYEVLLTDYFTNTEVNLADVGFGASQVLPIIVQGFVSSEDSTLLIEQPEIHLHPKAQCVMGDLLVDIIKTGKRRLIVETHSNLLIERVCKHILLKDESTITPEDIIIYYFEPSAEGTIIKPITVNKNAQFENFPEGFFEERFEEALARAELME